MRGQRPNGFTLIEVMISMAIIGILASVAIPSFRQMQLRSRAAERAYIVTSIYRAIDELWVRDGRFPLDQGVGESFLNLQNDQPDFAPSGQSKPWRHVAVDASDHWPVLQMSVEGAVYYRYGGFAYAGPTTRTYFLYAYGDLDNDGSQNRWEKTWTWLNGAKQLIPGSTLECGDCSFAEEINAWTF